MPRAFTAKATHWCKSEEKNQDAYEPGRGNRLRCIVQRSRPPHLSGRPDFLPFSDSASLRSTFADLDLPASYLQIADGSTGTAQAYTYKNFEGRPLSFELVVYCVAKQGDWAIALSHKACTCDTSVFWSLDERINSKSLTADMEALKDFAFHPMLIPCIIFEELLRLAVQRRHSIKERLQTLEHTMTRLGRKASFSLNLDTHHEQQDSGELEQLFDLLNSCRKDQASRRGRYDFWRSYHDALQQGMEYTASILATAPNETYWKAHDGLQRWSAMTWQKLESLVARDKDHINRVDNVSNMVSAISFPSTPGKSKNLD